MLEWHRLYYRIRPMRLKRRTGFCKVLISTYMKGGRISFRTHVRGDFAQHRGEIADRIAELEGLLVAHLDATGEGLFDKKIPRCCDSVS